MVSAGRHKDRDALVALYRSTSGFFWNKSTNWNTDAELSTWHGVEVNEEGRVGKIRLSFNNLRGNLALIREMFFFYAMFP